MYRKQLNRIGKWSLLVLALQLVVSPAWADWRDFVPRPVKMGKVPLPIPNLDRITPNYRAFKVHIVNRTRYAINVKTEWLTLPPSSASGNRQEWTSGNWSVPPGQDFYVCDTDNGVVYTTTTSGALTWGRQQWKFSGVFRHVFLSFT